MVLLFLCVCFLRFFQSIASLSRVTQSMFNENKKKKNISSSQCSMSIIIVLYQIKLSKMTSESYDVNENDENALIMTNKYTFFLNTFDSLSVNDV